MSNKPMKNSSASEPQNQIAAVIAENEKAMEKNSSEKPSSRRRFLQSAAGVAGGLALGLQVAVKAEDAKTAAPTEVTVPIPEKVLEKVGGYEVVQIENAHINDKVLVARVDAKTVIACSAVCTHRGCTVEYKHESGEIVCPCHGARYGTDGKVKQGPAKRDLKPYNARLALGISPRGEQ